ncbi:MAG TPA: biotin--[acetyl-CoA-carboxylase] ligase [Terracidiphilus sp.]|jgi:BirA family biotin operon repressor/biotin-[acetyl-CoA-carboxylase] ligase
MFNLPTLEAALANTIYANKLHFSPVTQSTNTDALQAARSGAPHGSVYFADEQLAGRGRGDHAWHSAAAQGLYVSILLRPSFPAARLSLLPFAAGLAAASAIRAAAALTIDLRWPNDLLIGPRKTGGILVEATINSQGLPHAVLGIGINVHQQQFPTDLSTPATSLDIESGQIISRQSLLIALLQSLAQEAQALESPTAPQSLPQRVQQSSTWITGRRVHVHGPQACTGITEGLDENGFLLVRTDSGIVTVQTGGLRAAQSDAGI